MNKLKLLGLSLLSGVLLGASWYEPFTFLIFIAFIPLLFVTDEIAMHAKRPKGTVFLFSYITFLVWNAVATWWTCYASLSGCAAAVVANALLMAFTYWIFFILYKAIKTKRPSLAIWLIVPVWLSFEYLHTLWELAWTWLTLGNAFCFQHNWVQWYEFTGVSGGSLWALALNILFYQLVNTNTKQGSKVKGLVALLVFAVPVIVSFIIKPTELKTGKGLGEQIVIVQPNIDPYNDKFNGDYESQLQLAYKLAKDKLTQETDYLVLPETFFTETIWENNLEQSYSVRFLRDSILRKYPKLVIITGASTFYQYKHGEKLSPTAHKYSDADEYYDIFNTGLQLDNFGPIQVYHKSKLVPGVERMPYPAVFGFLEKLTIDLGGTSGSLGTQDERGVFANPSKNVRIAPVICYESVFGEYVNGYIDKGANLIFIITNDGWWNDSPGFVQHLNFARLRAIETRMPIARCANTGISCFIDEKGELSQETKWWEPAVISGSIKPNNNRTFYVKCGDLLSKGALILLLISILAAIIFKFKKQKI